VQPVQRLLPQVLCLHIHIHATTISSYSIIVHHTHQINGPVKGSINNAMHTYYTQHGN
jgi:hypothetical protein